MKAANFDSDATVTHFIRPDSSWRIDGNVTYLNARAKLALDIEKTKLFLDQIEADVERSINSRILFSAS